MQLVERRLEVFDQDSPRDAVYYEVVNYEQQEVVFLIAQFEQDYSR